MRFPALPSSVRHVSPSQERVGGCPPQSELSVPHIPSPTVRRLTACEGLAHAVEVDSREQLQSLPDPSADERVMSMTKIVHIAPGGDDYIGKRDVVDECSVGRPYRRPVSVWAGQDSGEGLQLLSSPCEQVEVQNLPEGGVRLMFRPVLDAAGGRVRVIHW